MPKRRVQLVVVLLAPVLMLSLASGPARAAPLGPPDLTRLPPDLTALYFPATGHNLNGGFLRFWWERGQLPIFGFPISEELAEDGRTVQYFERARFEYYPEHRTSPAEVQLSHLGRDVTRQRAGEPAFQPVAPPAEPTDLVYFGETGHLLAAVFRRFWETRGGLATFGYPISEALSEDGRSVQYFERARLEHDPEQQGTAHEVQLAHLGRHVAEARGVSMATATPRAGATTWTPSLADELRERQLAAFRPIWLAAVPTAVEPFQAIVTAPVAEIRLAPTPAAGRVTLTYAHHIVRVVGVAGGEPVAGDDRWYQVAPSGAYIPAATVAPFTPPAPPRTWHGRWIDIDLSSFYITAYEGARPLYSALITAGRENRTPTGVFAVSYRTRRETMDSTTVGIPKGNPEYYYLTDVEYVQYFTGAGHAIHGNYWVHPSRFGRYSSNGCIGLLNPDAAWFWEFARTGTLVQSHD